MKDHNNKSAHGEVFVGIGAPIPLRRSLLECSKEFVRLLQKFEAAKALRDQKSLLLSQLRTEVNACYRLIHQLSGALPKAHVAEKKSEQKIAKPTSKKQKSSSTPVAVDISVEAQSEIQKLEAELSEIEHKLELLV